MIIEEERRGDEQIREEKRRKIEKDDEMIN